jgi:transcriptional regulator with PAS, ATPase and Fis domain
MEAKWSKEIGVGITVCDTEGIIISMNDMAEKIFRKSGGSDLIGKNLLDCHPEKAKKKILELFEKKQPYCYTVEMNDVKSMLYQAPWYENGNFMGFVEFIFALPKEVPQLHEINWVKK